MTLFRAVPVTDPTAHALLTEYFEMRVAGFLANADEYQTLYPDPAKFEPPAGVFIIAELESAAVGCGGIRMLSPVRAEVKHLWVRESARGHGVGSALLAVLESLAVEFGATEVVLDTHESLEAAGRLYARAGYEPTVPYNDNPNANLWLRKVLD